MSFNIDHTDSDCVARWKLLYLFPLAILLLVPTCLVHAFWEYAGMVKEAWQILCHGNLTRYHPQDEGDET